MVREMTSSNKNGGVPKALLLQTGSECSTGDAWVQAGSTFPDFGLLLRWSRARPSPEAYERSGP